ncbi:kinesin heavy chain-like [Montipora capricornis]|uniref:kinesin heavy chain-like n=1 Tax=Montipora capricornis TaxID=246305 RepID=UPI0035F1F607
MLNALADTVAERLKATLQPSIEHKQGQRSVSDDDESDEAESILSNMEGVTEQLLDEKKLMKKLEMDKGELKEKISRLQSQLDAIKVKEEDCQNRCQELEIRYNKEKERLSLIEDTVQRIGKNKERVKMTVHNFAPSLNLDDYE